MTVAELQAKSTPDERASVSAIQARAAAEASTKTMPYDQPLAPGMPGHPAAARRPGPTQIDMTTEPLRPDEAGDEPRTSNRLAKAITVTLVALVACGAVTAVAALSGGRPHRLSPSAPAVQPAVLTGPAVVRPDAIIQQLTTGSISGARQPYLPGAPGMQQGDPVGGEAAIRIVTDFYAYAAVFERRSMAFDLLGPTMQLDGLSAFDAAWRPTRVAEVNRFVLEPAGLLRVWVTIERLDGTVLRLVQRFDVRTVRVGGKPQSRIVGVQLLAAHRD